VRRALALGALALLAATATVASAQVTAPEPSRAEATRRWRERRLGLFVHWGVASGRALPQSHSHARHSALNPSGSVPAETYDQYYKEFNPTAYDPDAWLKLAHDAGMRFDGIEPVGPERWKDTPARVAAMLHELQPGIMLSNHGGGPEDFVSFEMMVGPFDRVQPWEMTEPINPSGWVFNQPMPTRPFRELLRNLVYTVSRDGNYLLDVGPMPDGRLYPPDAERLAELAQWMKANAEGIHGTRGGPYRDGDWGGATCRDRSARDRRG
jgi:hypothetical protein